jgi:hypothetical protein
MYEVSVNFNKFLLHVGFFMDNSGYLLSQVRDFLPMLVYEFFDAFPDSLELSRNHALNTLKFVIRLSNQPRARCDFLVQFVLELSDLTVLRRMPNSHTPATYLISDACLKGLDFTLETCGLRRGSG